MKILRLEVSKGAPMSGGLTDLMDMAIYSLYNITSDELDTICKLCTDEEMDQFVDGLGSLDTPPTFTEKRQGLMVRNKYVDYYKK